MQPQTKPFYLKAIDTETVGLGRNLSKTISNQRISSAKDRETSITNCCRKFPVPTCFNPGEARGLQDCKERSFNLREDKIDLSLSLEIYILEM